jgi:hypothetical protein
MTGREGEGGGGGEYKGECLFHNNRDKDEYDNDKEYNDKEDGKGLHRGVDSGGKSNYKCCNVICRPSFGGVGRRMLIVGPHTAAVVINDDDVDNNRRRGGGSSCPPPSGSSRPTGHRLLLSMLPTAVDGGGTRVFGAW